MPSNINRYTVDGTFPIANQDNSSQGFRDNFTNIQTNFAYAANEITDLQNKYHQIGSGLLGTLPNAMSEKEFLNELKQKFRLKVIRHSKVVVGNMD